MHYTTHTLEDIRVENILLLIVQGIFILIIYTFMYRIINLIYLDIKFISRKSQSKRSNMPYLKLLNLIDNSNFKLSESYVIGNKTYIGRNSGNDIVLDAPFFSGKHACIFKQNNDFYVEDLGSKNGTFVNGQSIKNTPIIIKNGDIIQIGQIISFIFINEN
jgi:pSer/pThr/pTyr-binding forkhead associated (FHA) protein